ncbi:flagellar filament capping protein FliD [Novosphingobium piscinae]|uniref:Flagellar hook-associated protein 2 n=1 Tax=Novosphingobium piscinae TaxID=1507448 RepID=A0A7X1KR77_9SPHN|nr:flagellar filament capping protein FliD [Novosphingobium piscinae]MBC2670496.1 flagellar filament capping protein FliD [Novosphingobium piscinae]
MSTTSAATTRSAASSAILTSLNGANSVDWNTLAANLAAAQFAGQTDRLTTRTDTLDKQISVAGNLRSMLQTFATSIGDRVRSGDLSPQPSLSAAVATPRLSGSATPRGSYTLEVTQLAAAQSLASPPVASTTATVGSGTLTLRFGTVAGSSFTEDTARPAIDLTIAAGADIADIASAINGARAGVSAYVANTTDGPRLMVKGAEGAVNGFVIEATEDPADPGLAQFAWNPTMGATNRLLTTAQNASFRLDGLPMSSPTNTVNEVIPGLNLTLTATNTGAPATLTFADNTSAISEVMTDFVSALNQLASEVRTATDPLSGDLARDGGALALKRSLSQLSGQVIMPNAPAGAPRTLADLGVAIQRDGTFQLDGARLTAALRADPTGVAAMFTNGIDGVYSTIDGLARRMNRSTDAFSLTSSVNRYTGLKTRLSSDLAAIADKQELLRQQLVTRFAKTQTNVSASTSTLTFLKNQIDAWNSSNN